MIPVTKSLDFTSRMTAAHRRFTGNSQGMQRFQLAEK
jgi:hypothetical protein